MQYRKKPVVIEAIQWNGNNHREVFNFLGGEDGDYIKASGVNFYMDWNKVEGGLIIKTLEGEHIASINDFIIKGVNGEFYPCKPDIFEKTYSQVGEQETENSEFTLSKAIEKVLKSLEEDEDYKETCIATLLHFITTEYEKEFLTAPGVIKNTLIEICERGIKKLIDSLIEQNIKNGTAK